MQQLWDIILPLIVFFSLKFPSICHGNTLMTKFAENKFFRVKEYKAKSSKNSS